MGPSVSSSHFQSLFVLLGLWFSALNFKPENDLTNLLRRKLPLLPKVLLDQADAAMNLAGLGATLFLVEG